MKLTKDQIKLKNWSLEQGFDEECVKCGAELNPKTAVPLWHKQLDWHIFGSDCARRTLKEQPNDYFTTIQTK